MQDLSTRIKARIENILSRILSDKYKAKVKVKFKKRRNQNGDIIEARIIEEEQISHK